MTRSGIPRRLTPEDVLLWRAVAKTVDRHADSTLPDPPPPPISPAASPPPQRETAVPARPTEKPVRRTAAPPLTDLDRRTRTKIARGRIGIERSVDLHGLSQAEAHAALRRFLFSAYSDDLRLVLVVTGKGERPSAAMGRTGTGVLKRMVPHWLRELDLRPVVLGFELASVAHGGAGALYIRLRRRTPGP